LGDKIFSNEGGGIAQLVECPTTVLKVGGLKLGAYKYFI
jgi:hypothetical protein